jgi:phosphotransferase system HPr-like phosphotransfer protein
MSCSKFVKINNIEDVNKLVTLSTNSSEVVELHKGRWCVDASSLMGVMSLDLSTGVTVVFDEDDDELYDFLDNKQI